MTNYTELKRQAEEMLSKMERGKEFIINQVSDRLSIAVEENPQDHVIIAMAHVIERMARKDPTRIICQAEMEDLYQNLVGLNVSSTRFREKLGDFLLTSAPEPVKQNTVYAQSNRDPLKEAFDEINPEIRNAMKGVFEEDSQDIYDIKKAMAAREKVSLELRSLGFNPKIKLVGGNSRFVVFAANFDTNHGTITTHIPAEASGTKFPSVMVSGNEIKTLTKSAINNHINTTSRNNKPVNIDSILTSLDMLTGHHKKIASRQQLEKTIEKVSEGSGSGFSAPELFASLAEENVIEDIKIDNIEVPEPLKLIATELDESILETSLNFPLQTVRLAKRMLYAELTAMGFKGSQISISSSTDDGLICNALIDTPSGKVSIEVPIEMKNNQPLMPSVFAHGDYIDDFSQEKLASFIYTKADISEGVIRRDNDLASENINQLRNALASAVSHNDFTTCDDILEVVSAKFDKSIYLDMVRSYHNMLKTAGMAKKAYSKSKCSMIIKNNSSIYPMCGHLMLPLHEVIQDENGRCHRASTYNARKNQQEEGLLFSNAKVLFND